MIQREAMREGVKVIIFAAVVAVAVMATVMWVPIPSGEGSPDSETGTLRGAGRDMSAVTAAAESETDDMGEWKTAPAPATQADTEVLIDGEAQSEAQSESEIVETISQAVDVEPYMYAGGFDEDAYYIAKTIGVEAPHCSVTEQAAVAWTILNRVDDVRFPDTVADVVTAPRQFAYFETTPVREDLYLLALDVLGRWALEAAGEPVVGRVLPREYVYFTGDGRHNHFRVEENRGAEWDWSLESPYEY